MSEYNVRAVRVGDITPKMLRLLVSHWQGANGLQTDGICGPITRASLLERLSRPDTDPDKSLALMALEVARRCIGMGERDRQNDGTFIRSLRAADRTGRGQNRGPWCAAFVSYCFAQAAEFRELPFKTSRGAKRLVNNIGQAGAFIDTPEPGAVVCWHRGVFNWQGHVGIVEEYHEPSDTLQWIDGNVGPFPSAVARRVSAGGEWRRWRLYAIAICP